MGSARAEVVHGTPTQSHMSPSIPVYEENALLSSRRNLPSDHHTFVAREEGRKCCSRIQGAGFRNERGVLRRLMNRG